MASVIYALWRGGRPERIVGAATLLAWVATLALEDRRDWFELQWGILAVDFVFLAVLVALALVTDRSWLLFASAFQLLSVVTHLAISLDRGVRSLAYLRSLTIWSYLILMSLALGAHAYRRRVQTMEAAAAPARR